MRYNSTKFFIYLVVLFAMINAQEQKNIVSDMMQMDLSDFMHIKITTASKKVETVADAPAIITVFTRADLDKLRPRNLNELLGYTPGFLVAQEDDDYSLGNRGVVSDNNQSYLIAIDGHSIGNTNNFGINPFNLTRNLIDNAERIEIIRGPGGVFWGPEAFLGVINVITPKPQKQDENDVKVSLIGGKNNTIGGYISSCQRVDKNLTYSFYADIIHSDGEPINLVPKSEGGRWSNDFNGVNIIGRFEDPSISIIGRIEHKDFWIAGHITHTKKFVPGWLNPSVEDFTQMYFDMGQRIDINTKQKISIKLFADKYQAIRRPSSNYSNESFGYDFPELRIGSEILWNASWVKKPSFVELSTIVGLNPRYYYYEGGILGETSSNEYEKNIGNWNVYGNPLPDTIFTNNDTILTKDALNLPDTYVNPIFGHQLSTAQGTFIATGILGQVTLKLLNKLTLNAGLRVDIFTDHFDYIASPRFAATYYIDDNWNIKALFSKASSRPSWTQRYGFFSANSNNNNNDLIEPERNQNIELAVSGKVDNKIQSNLTIFHQKIDDKINLVTPKAGTVYKGVRIDSVYGLAFYNYGRYTTIGIEWDTRAQINNILSMFFSPTAYLKVSRDENFTVGGTAGAGEVVSNGEPELGFTYGNNKPFSIPDYFFSIGATVSIPVKNSYKIGITPIARYQGKTKFHAVKDAPNGGRIGYEWDDDILLADLKAWFNGSIKGSDFDVSLNIINIFNNTKVVGFSSGQQAAMHMRGIYYEGKLTVTF